MLALKPITKLILKIVGGRKFHEKLKLKKLFLNNFTTNLINLV